MLPAQLVADWNSYITTAPIGVQSVMPGNSAYIQLDGNRVATLTRRAGATPGNPGYTANSVQLGFLDVNNPGIEGAIDTLARMFPDLGRAWIKMYGYAYLDVYVDDTINPPVDGRPGIGGPSNGVRIGSALLKDAIYAGLVSQNPFDMSFAPTQYLRDFLHSITPAQSLQSTPWAAVGLGKYSFGQLVYLMRVDPIPLMYGSDMGQGGTSPSFYDNLNSLVATDRKYGLQWWLRYPGSPGLSPIQGVLAVAGAAVGINTLLTAVAPSVANPSLALQTLTGGAATQTGTTANTSQFTDITPSSLTTSSLPTNFVPTYTPLNSTQVQAMLDTGMTPQQISQVVGQAGTTLDASATNLLAHAGLVAPATVSGWVSASLIKVADTAGKVLATAAAATITGALNGKKPAPTVTPAPTSSATSIGKVLAALAIGASIFYIGF